MTPEQERILTDLIRAVSDDAIHSLSRRRGLADLAGISDHDYFGCASLAFLLLFISIIETVDPDLTEQELYNMFRGQLSKTRIRFK